MIDQKKVKISVEGDGLERSKDTSFRDEQKTKLLQLAIKNTPLYNKSYKEFVKIN